MKTTIDPNDKNLTISFFEKSNHFRITLPAPCFIGNGCPKRDFPESWCPFIEGYILYNMIKQDAVGVWTPRTPPMAPALHYLRTHLCI